MKKINWWKVASVAMMAASEILSFGHDLIEEQRSEEEMQDMVPVSYTHLAVLFAALVGKHKKSPRSIARPWAFFYAREGTRTPKDKPHAPQDVYKRQVYGIAADARNGAAVAKIFVAKGRPQDNPLIVHVTGPAMLPGLVSEVPERAQLLMEMCIRDRAYRAAFQPAAGSEFFLP